MTLPDERYRAVQWAKKFLEEVAFTTPRIPKAVREEARRVLRHYPTDWDLDQIEQYAPHIVQQRMEPLYKMIKQQEMAESVAKDYRAEGLITQHPAAAKKIDLDDPNWEPHL